MTQWSAGATPCLQASSPWSTILAVKEAKAPMIAHPNSDFLAKLANMMDTLPLALESNSVGMDFHTAVKAQGLLAGSLSMGPVMKDGL